MTITVTGRTFDHRDRLKQLGGVWNSDDKNWIFYNVKPKDLAELKNLSGCLVTDSKERKVEPWTPPLPPIPTGDASEDNDDDGGILAKLFGGDVADRPCIGDRASIVYGDDERYLNHFKDKNPTAFFGFSSINEMCKFVESIPHDKRTGNRAAGWEANKNWAASRDMAHAIDLARNGWNEGIENAAKILDMFNVEHAVQRRRRFDVAGGSVSVGRLLAGNPAHMVKRLKQPGRKVVTLFVENVASAYINADSLTVRAAIVAAFADIMERNGYSCEIVAMSIVAGDFGNTKPGAHTVVTVKHAGEKLNINDLAFTLGHPSFLRRLSFACVSQCDELRDLWSTQGYPTEAFNKYHPLGRNEFAIRHLKENIKGETLEERARKMLPLVKPRNLPLEIG